LHVVVANGLIGQTTTYSVQPGNVFTALTEGRTTTKPITFERQLDAVQGAALLKALATFVTTDQPDKQFHPDVQDAPRITVSGMVGDVGRQVLTDGAGAHAATSQLLSAVGKLAARASK